ncbi:Predicted ATPase [Plesiocystis pacifica SIR-1]|uniref:Predicted ATPase n=1 Tax=Plesiocystis pacifica SIR-1 TaxID=391625 RepID=A6FXI7_9BACT|nr:AAA family ATPase [Plesiocystis pacifica]EDM81575.1 Predicted ATPase [Plesiocystis pacifica SIR-1]
MSTTSHGGILRSDATSEANGRVRVASPERPWDQLARARLSREAELMWSLNAAKLPGIPSLVSWDPDSATLTYAPSTTAPLLRGLGPGLSLTRAIELAAGMASWLARMHAQGVLYLSVTPAALAWDPATRQLEARTLGSARRIGEINHPKLNDWQLGNFPYLAPEQSGRMPGCRPDGRSDLYGLGVTLFELMAGRLPLLGRDQDDWIEAHLNRPPRRLAGEGLDIPDALDAFVSQLLAKDPNERPPSAQACADRLAAFQEQFEIGMPLVSSAKLSAAPTRLSWAGAPLEREETTAALRACFETCVKEKRPTLGTIHGAMGSGKTAAVEYLRVAVSENGGAFARAKFDAIPSAIPYAALLRAFDALLDDHLPELDEAELETWRVLLDAGLGLGDHADLLMAMSPALANLLPDRPTLTELGPDLAKARLREAVERLVDTIPRERPLLLFLDDLQWADGPSLEFLAELLSPNAKARPVCCIAAYEDDELDADHPVSAFLAKVRADHQDAPELTLAPLSRESVDTLLAYGLELEVPEVAELGAVVYAESGGNPRRAVEFLDRLERERLIHHTDGRWRWELDQIS